MSVLDVEEGRWSKIARSCCSFPGGGVSLDLAGEIRGRTVDQSTVWRFRTSAIGTRRNSNRGYLLRYFASVVSAELVPSEEYKLDEST